MPNKAKICTFERCSKAYRLGLQEVVLTSSKRKTTLYKAKQLGCNQCSNYNVITKGPSTHSRS